VGWLVGVLWLEWCGLGGLVMACDVLRRVCVCDWAVGVFLVPILLLFLS